MSSFRGNGLPVAQSETPNDQPVNIRFGESVLVPDELDRRVLPPRQCVDRVIFPRNVYDHRAGAFAAQLTVGQLKGRPPKHQHDNSGSDSPKNDQRERFDYVFHNSYALHSGLKARPEVLSILLKGKPVSGLPSVESEPAPSLLASQTERYECPKTRKAPTEADAPYSRRTLDDRAPLRREGAPNSSAATGAASHLKTF